MNAPTSRGKRRPLVMRISWRQSRPVLCMPKPKRPQRRSDCAGGLRPCPWATCSWHAAQVRSECKGSRLPMGQVPDVAEWAQTCTLDVIEQDGATLEDVGEVVGVTRERIRQIERATMAQLDQRWRRRLAHLVNASPVYEPPPLEWSTEPETRKRPQKGYALLALMKRLKRPVYNSAQLAELSGSGQPWVMEQLKALHVAGLVERRFVKVGRSWRYEYWPTAGRAS